jgi:beta-lactam-binding protein with PASTA domain
VTVSTGAGSISVPNVVNLAQSAATAAITGAGLVVGAVTTGSSATVPAGSVISQSPIAGTGVSAGSAVALLVSSGPANVTVPNVVNLAQGAATAAITGAGLVVGAITNANSATVPAGSVISQNPIAGASVAPGSAVALVISSGPATATVPNVVNLAQAAASSAITGAGLAVGTITSANSVTVAAGSVISQNPVGGTVVAQGSAVALVISLGPANVAVPNVVNLTQAAATTAIVNASLVVGAITSANSATIAAGNVISQNPAAAALVAPGSAVALVISLGPAGTGPTVVASVTSAVNGRGNQTVQISTTVPTRLVAFVSADGPQNVGAGGQASTLSGGGLSWTLVARANLQFGDAEIWTADAPAALAGAAITSTLLRHRTGSDYIHLVRLVAFTGVSGVGASNVASGQTVAVASVSLNAQAAGSVIYAVGQDWTNGVTRTFPAGQVQDVQMVGADLDTFWVQRTAGRSPRRRDHLYRDQRIAAAPGDRWNFAIIELKR